MPLFWWLIACKPEPLPDTWTLSDDGISVIVSKEPYAFSVRDGEGTVVLTTSEGGDGYSAPAWNSGYTYWETLGSPGYFKQTVSFGEWRDDWVVVDADEAAGALTLTLAPPSAIDAKGRVDEEEPLRMTVRHEVRDSAFRLEAKVQGDDPRAWSIGFDSPEAEGFLGFGERMNRTDQRGVKVYSWLEEGGIGLGEGTLAGAGNPTPNGEAMAYYPVPFFISTEGYGFWLDSTWYNEFDLATDRDDAWKVWHTGPELAFEVYTKTPDDSRSWPYQLIDRFTEATGRPMIPPDWTFGPRRRTGRTSTVEGVPELQAMRDQDLALTAADDSVHFLPRGSHVGIEDDLLAWTTTARELGYRTNAYYNAYLDDNPENPLIDTLNEAKDEGYLLADAEGELSVSWLISGSPVNIVTFDFTNPDAVAYYQDTIQWMIDLGYSGAMFDFGEYVQPEVLTHSGMTGEEFHNLFPVFYNEAVYNKFESSELAGDWLAFVRAGYTGSSQYAPMIWGGDPAASFEDSDGLPSMVRAGINVGISGGANWGGDINGFHCAADGNEAADGELLARWIQQGAMSSNMQDQNACAGLFNAGPKASIWTAPEGKESWRTYARLHTRLFPYFRTLAEEAHATGAPIIRHVFLENPDRPDLAGVDDAFYLGEALYVAPVVDRGATTKTIELPAGFYLDWTDQELLVGGATLVIDAPIAKLPLLLRDGRLIPLLDPTIDTLSEEENPEVVGPTDVAEVYDVVGLLSTDIGGASYTVYDDTSLTVAWTGDFAPGDLTLVGDESELSSCTACYLVEEHDGVSRVRISANEGTVQAGGLTLTSNGERRIRWDLYLVP